MSTTSTNTRVSRTRQASQGRREQRRQELRERILQAAGEEFLEHGYESFSLRRVAERIGYTPTTIYLYFHNKDDLLRATVQQGFEDFDRRIEEVAAAHRDPIERIDALGRAYIDFGLRNPALYRLMFMQRSDFYFMPPFGEEGDSAAMAGPDQPRTVAMAALVAAVDEAIEAGTAHPGNSIITADVLWAGAHGLVSLAISPLLTPEHVQKMIDPLLATLIDGVKRH